MSATADSVRRLKRRAAAFDSWAATKDRTKRTAPARDARLERLAAEVDPEGEMSVADRRKAAEAKRRAHMARISALGIEARRRAKQNKGAK
jgi:hypothetical protein